MRVVAPRTASSTATAPRRPPSGVGPAWVSDGAPPVGGRGVRGRARWAAGSCFRRSDERAPAARPGHDLRSKLQGFAPVAIHPSYRTSLRSSSNDEPRYPSLKVVSLPPEGGRLAFRIRRRLGRAYGGPVLGSTRRRARLRTSTLRGGSSRPTDRPPARRTGGGRGPRG